LVIIHTFFANYARLMPAILLRYLLVFGILERKIAFCLYYNRSCNCSL